MRCPSCGATNPDRADWCGQCYVRLREPPPPAQPPAPPPPPQPARHPAGMPPSTLPPPPPPPGHPADQHAAPADEDAERLARRGLRRVDGELEWACVTCGAFNPMERPTCATCGTAFAARFAPPEEEPERDWRTALIATALLPGAGHWLVGRAGSGVARGVLYLVWLLGGLLILGGGGGVAPAAPLLLGAAAIWGGSLADVLRLQAGQPELLVGRTMLWLVVGVTVLLLVGVVAGAMAVR